jgi:hypothetical protein
MNKEKAINIVTRGLLAFVLVTVGFGIGKEVTLRRMQTSALPSPVVTGDQVVATYAHATIRCVSCETIERLTHETLNEQFASELAAGRVVFRKVNFQEETHFAQHYGIVANCVIVSRIEQGKEIEHRRLDEVWELYEDPPAFKQCLGDAIRNYLATTQGGGDA